MPTDEQLRKYLEQVPQIYHDILSAYPKLSPERKTGGGVMVLSLVDHFGPSVDDNRGEFFPAEHDEDEILDALSQLEERGFLARDPKLNTLSYAPTAVGERLISLLTGFAPRPKGAPPLPQPTWG